jgi:hypothetical protein
MTDLVYRWYRSTGITYDIKKGCGVLLPANLTALSDEALQQAIVAEMVHLHASGAGMRLELSPQAAFAVVAMCQLGLRHPQASASEAATLVRDFIQYARGKFLPYAPAIAEAISRGADPDRDKEVISA